MLRHTLLTISISLCLITQGCSLLFDSEPEHENTDSKNQEVFIHTVNFPGETLELVGRWYTGGRIHRERIQKDNPELPPGLLPLGSRVKIMRVIMSTDKLLPVEFVKKNSQESSSPFILNTPLEDVENNTLPETTIMPETDILDIPPIAQDLPEVNSNSQKTIFIPSQMTEELKEFGAQQTPAHELPSAQTEPPTIIVEPTEEPTLQPVLAPEPTISEGRRRLLEQIQGTTP